MQWPCMRISESAKTSRTMRTMRRLSAQQAPSANASQWLCRQCVSSDGLGPSPNALAALQNPRAHTRIEPQQAASTERRADVRAGGLRKIAGALLWTQCSLCPARNSQCPGLKIDICVAHMYPVTRSTHHFILCEGSIVTGPLVF